MRTWSVHIILVCSGVAGALLAGCAANSNIAPAPQYLAATIEHTSEPLETVDPYEKQNRSILESNQEFNKSIVYPIADAYHDTVPEPVRDTIENFTSNLGEPAIFANDMLQLRLKAAVATTGRFIVNSTVGLGGLFDVASQQNLPRQSGDFGQTLYVWGVHDSPYLVLPVLGPTNVRDAVGNGFEFVATSLPTGGFLGAKLANTVNNVGNVGTALTPFSGLNKADDLRELEKGSLDFYVMLRSVVDQKRQAELKQALADSAFSPPAGPIEPDYATEAIMSLHSSPAWIEQVKSTEKTAHETPRTPVDQSGTKVIIGPLQQVVE